MIPDLIKLTVLFLQQLLNIRNYQSIKLLKNNDIAICILKMIYIAMLDELRSYLCAENRRLRSRNILKALLEVKVSNTLRKVKPWL